MILKWNYDNDTMKMEFYLGIGNESVIDKGSIIYKAREENADQTQQNDNINVIWQTFCVR